MIPGEYSVTVDMQFDPDNLVVAKGKIDKIAAQLEITKKDLLKKAKDLQFYWNSTAGYGYLLNSLVPTYEKIEILESKLREMSAALNSVAGEYGLSTTNVAAKVEELPQIKL